LNKVPSHLEDFTIVLALVGMPGSGKSTVGRQLARKLGVGFVDCDQVIEMRIGMPIKDFFASKAAESMLA
jgi:shikimate kinase